MQITNDINVLNFNEWGLDFLKKYKLMKDY